MVDDVGIAGLRSSTSCRKEFTDMFDDATDMGAEAEGFPTIHALVVCKLG